MSQDEADRPRASTGELLHVAGVGASAGGLEALQELVGPLQPGTGCAFVILQHLSATHASLLVELLAGATGLTVIAADDGVELLPDVIFIGPPGHDVTIDDGRLRVSEVTGRPGPQPSIDTFLQTLADQWHERAVAVILSGTGSDGAHGMRSVKGEGGLTMAQTPEEARFDGMPRAAIALGAAEIVGEARALGERLNHLEQFERAGADTADAETDVRALDAIVQNLKRSIGIDFSLYKEPTVRRQIRRRMAVRQVQDIDEYLALVADDPDEAHALSRNLLVTVTSFFRGPEAFEALGREIQRLVADRGDELLRIWVPGCASGEEAYSIVMLVGEALGHPADLARRLQIFATDLDESSLAIARRGVYPDTALKQIPERFHDRYLRRTSPGIQVAEVVRECVVFARHDVSLDAPFSRLDLISCRNVFIYFTTSLQRHVLDLFAFGLRPGGLLFLGEAENLALKTPCFRVDDERSRIFVRTSEPIAPVGPFTASKQKSLSRLTRDTRRVDVAGHAPDRQVLLLQELLRDSGFGYLVLDDAHNLVQVVGDVSDFCQVPEGRISARAESYVRAELREDAATLLLVASTSEEPTFGQRIRLSQPDRTVQMRVSKVRVGDTVYTVLTLMPAGEETTGLAGANLGNERLLRMERELTASRDTLRRSLNQLQLKNEELEAFSEELQAASEELQASNEELQASNEELQAANEELSTLNIELRQRTDDLQRINTDLENIQASSSQGMVIVDRDYRVTRFTPLAVRLFALVEADIGQPLLTIPTTLETPGLEPALRRVVEGEARTSIRVSDAEISYLVQVLPYRSLDGRSLGAIITLTDITELDQLRTTAEAALAELTTKSDQLAHQAAHDFVTGLLNRDYFTEVLHREMARVDRDGGRLALGWIDVDRFKEINDEFGHNAGDMVLRVTGERLIHAVRGSDFVGRIGGDEFGVVVSGYHHLAELDAILDRLVAALRAVIDVDGQEARIAGSVGVALYPDDGSDPDALMRAADTAMYSVKHAAGDAYGYFSPEMQVVADERRRMRTEIAEALGHDRFELHYQPIVDAATNAPVAVESLVRWHRDGSVVPAADFVPFCEKSGQIRSLGLTTLSLLQSDTKKLRDAGHSDLLVSFNMTVTQLEDPNFIELLDSWPESDGLRGIVIEVVESILLPDHRLAMATLRRLTELGAHTAIDDYGAGYSNARALEALSPTYIKLDRSFLSDRHSADARTALIKSAIEVAHVVGSKVIAEGVEDAEQRALLMACGANYVQGYGIVAPMPLSQTLEWLRTPHAPVG